MHVIGKPWQGADLLGEMCHPRTWKFVTASLGRELSWHAATALGQLYSFPVAALTNYHVLGGFKQQIFVLSQFCGQKFKVEVEARLPCPWSL